jgi:hypothetical protein
MKTNARQAPSQTLRMTPCLSPRRTDNIGFHCVGMHSDLNATSTEPKADAAGSAYDLLRWTRFSGLTLVGDRVGPEQDGSVASPFVPGHTVSQNICSNIVRLDSTFTVCLCSVPRRGAELSGTPLPIQRSKRWEL